MPTVPFIEAVQTRAARIACGASATRGQGAGVVAAGRDFLNQLPLSQFSVGRRSLFEQRLEDATQNLCAAFSSSGRSWGLARKVLNIFLRDALYTSYLADTFHLRNAEANFEIPLDSITARHLRKRAGRGHLPLWLGVKHLTPEASAEYQLFASQFAVNHHMPRVHLDTYWWGHRDI
jgi:hypothetical protein